MNAAVEPSAAACRPTPTRRFIVLETVHLLLTRSLELIRSPENWSQDALSRGEHGRSVDALSQEARSYCALGALLRTANELTGHRAQFAIQLLSRSETSDDTALGQALQVLGPLSAGAGLEGVPVLLAGLAERATADRHPGRNSDLGYFWSKRLSDWQDKARHAEVVDAFEASIRTVELHFALRRAGLI
jgi:hypothetical protein